MTEETLFTEALEVADPAARAAFLDRACAGDPALRGRIERLLAQHAEAGSFLGRPAPLPATGAQDAPAGGPTGTTPPGSPAGGTVGPYKLVEVIGEGGMGTVWLAQQQEPVKRLVALKVIKAGMDSRSVLARFEAERQALALMDHPNIARVFDGGATPAGRPFFVMELVKGVPITRFCDERRLTPRERLELFVPVCQAVQHAHQKGVIHRDIKPSNVLVTLYDGRPVPKVIDFGIAKAAGQPLTERTLITGLGAVVGTPEHMSPEQAELNQLDVDTRSDVYSLGVLLYELLTGTPLQRKRVKEAALLEVLRLVREEEPPRPSTRLSTTDELPSIAANRGVEPRRLSGLVRGDLDWIVMKALEKDRGRRYDTATGLAADVQRYLSDEPVLACPPSAAYRLRKFARRNRGPVLAAAAVLLALVAGVVGTTRGLVEARHQRDQADRARRDQADLLRETEWRLYATQVGLALQAWEGNSPLLALHHLKSCNPDLRGWEYDHLFTRFHSHQRTYPVDADHVRYSPDGTRLAGGRAGGNVTVWDAATGRIAWTHAATKSVNGVAWSPDGRHVATASEDGSVTVWDVAAGAPAGAFRGHTRAARCVAWSPDGRRAASGGVDRVVRVWDPTTGAEIRTFPGLAGRVNGLAWSPDGRLLGCGGDNGVWVWAQDRWGVAQELPGHTAQVTGVAFSPDGTRLASAGGDRTVRVWDPAAGRLVRTIGGAAGAVRDVAFNPAGTRLAAGGDDGTVTVWDAATGREVRTLRGHAQALLTVAWHPDGTRLATASADGTVKVWDPVRAAGHETRSLQGVSGAVSSVAISPDGTRIFGGESTGPVVVVWDAATGHQVRCLLGHKGSVTGVAVSPDGTHVATSNADGTVKVWDAATGAETRTFRGHGDRVYCVAFGPGGRAVASGGADTGVRVWDPATGAEQCTLRGHTAAVTAVAFRPDGGRLAAAGYDHTVRVWDPATGAEEHTLRGHTGPVGAVAWTPDGTRLVTGSEDGTVTVWDAAAGREVRTLRGHGGPVRGVAVSPDGTRIATGSDDKTVKLWDAATGHETLTLPGHTREVVQVAWGPGGRRLLSGGADGTVRVWEAGLARPDP